MEISRFPPLCGVPSLGAIPHRILDAYESLKPSSLVSSGCFSPSFIFTLGCLFCFVECLSGNQRHIKCFSLPEAGKASCAAAWAQASWSLRTLECLAACFTVLFHHKDLALCQCSYWQPCGPQPQHWGCAGWLLP